ncbi:MAG: hypothetical protein U5K29_00625 [Acidimicrobiales bacterium]|nr:hypothetical protein [Acidimicrobiales bacterium]
MIEIDLAEPMGVEWVPALEHVESDPRASLVAEVKCGEKGCGVDVGLRVISVGGTRLLVGERRLVPRRMEDESRRTIEERRDRARVERRPLTNGLGRVAIPLEGEPGRPVTLTQAIRNAVADPTRFQGWEAWLSSMDDPRWETVLTADCGYHDRVFLVADAHSARRRQVLVTREYRAV